MEEMLRELEEELSCCKKEMKTFKQNLSQQLSNASTDCSNNVQNYEHVITKGNKYTFSKAPRFKPAKPEVIEEQAAAELITIEAFLPISKRQTNVLFSKSERFPEKSAEPEPQTDINPNFEAVKKKVPSAVIKPEAKPIITPFKQKLMESGYDISYMDELETEASMSRIVGPGAYNITYNLIDQKKSIAFSKASRFQMQKEEEQTLINPNYDAVRRKPPTAVISKKTERTKQLQLRDQIEQMDEQLRAEEYRRRPLEIDRAIRPNPPQVMIRKSYNQIMNHPPGSRIRRFLIQKLLDDIKYRHGLGPGAYDIKDPKAEPCMVVIKAHSAERRIPNLERPVPGPDYYYSKDDYIKPNPIKIQFGKEERIKKVRKEDLDMRPALNLDINPIKPAVVGGVINPEGETHSRVPPENLLIENKIGPGKYDQNYKFVEPRTDIGVVKFQQITEKNDRVNVIDPIKNKEFFDYQEMLLPDLEPIMPHKAAFQYHEPTDQQPQHPPDKLLFPEEFKHYDVNLDAIKEKVGKTDIPLAGKKGRGLEEFLQYEEDLNQFKNYLFRQNRIPDLGQYQVNYKQIDYDPQAADFNRYIDRELKPIEKPEGAVDGDNLILNPDKLQKHLQNLNFENQVERPEIVGKNEHEAELIINPNYDAVKPRVKNVMDFEKQLDRPPTPKQKDVELLIEPQFKLVEPKVKGNHNFEKQVDREEDPRFIHKVDDRPLLIEPNEKVVKPKLKNFVKMNNETKKNDKLIEKESQQEKQSQPKALDLSKIDRADKAIRPHVPGVNMKNQAKRKLSVQKK